MGRPRDPSPSKAALRSRRYRERRAEGSKWLPPPPEAERRCSLCGVVKSRSEFNLRSKGKPGLQSQCRVCAQSTAIAWARAHREILSLRQKEWAARNPDRAIEIEKRSLAKNRNKRRERSRLWRDLNLDKVRAWQRDYGKRSGVKARKRAYRAHKKASDPAFHLAVNIRSRLSGALRRRKAIKGASAVALLGCTISQAALHLERQFKPGMTWENWGYRGWHIDHIRPLSSFDLTDPEQLAQACHYTNLQPLWRAENQAKGSKWPLNDGSPS